MSNLTPKSLPNEAFNEWFRQKAMRDPVFHKMHMLRPQFDNNDSFMHFMVMTLSDLLDKSQEQYLDHMLGCRGYGKIGES